jgi:predicted HTH domain antitoxin
MPVPVKRPAAEGTTTGKAKKSVHGFDRGVCWLAGACWLRMWRCDSSDDGLTKVLGVLDAIAKEMSELSEQGLKLLIPTYYKNEKELLKEAFRIIIRNNPKVRIDLALKLYNSKKTSLAKSAEIAGLTTIEFKEILADRGIKREIEGDEIEEIDRKIKEVFG